MEPTSTNTGLLLVNGLMSLGHIKPINHGKNVKVFELLASSNVSRLSIAIGLSWKEEPLEETGIFGMGHAQNVKKTKNRPIGPFSFDPSGNQNAWAKLALSDTKPSSNELYSYIWLFQKLNEPKWQPWFYTTRTWFQYFFKTHALARLACRIK